MILAAATADCELNDDWLWRQDVNAWSSLAYLGAAGVLVVAVGRRRLPRSVLALAAVTAAEAAGSVLYHGTTGGGGGHFLHDTALIGMLGYIAGWQVGRLLRRPERAAVLGTVAALVIEAVAWSVTSGATNVVAAVAGLTVAVSEVLARRRGSGGVWNLPLLALAGVAGLTWIGGTTSSPLCDESSWFQVHGLWHMLSALLVVAWVDRAYSLDGRSPAPRFFRRATDRGLGLVTGLLTHAFHRSVDVVGRDLLPTGRPVLIVANHGNGFVDPVVVASVLGRLPRFLAKAALWRVIPARPFLAIAGVLPVGRAAEGDASGSTVSTFASCHAELADGASVAIFPEGTTGDRGGLERVRSGAARIALGARATAPHLAIVPIGLEFESRVDTRSRALVMVGEPIDVDDWTVAWADRVARPDAGAAVGEDDHAAVHALTDSITSALAAVSPLYASVDERDVMRAAARMTLTSSSRRDPRFADVEILARRIAASPAPDRELVSAATRRVASSIYLLGLSDEDLRRSRLSLRRLALSVVALVVAGSFVVTMTLIHLPALLLVVTATQRVRSTASKGTVRMLVGLAAGLLTWIVAGVVLADGAAAVVVAVVVAGGGALALAVWDPLVRTARSLVGSVRARDRANLLRPVARERDDLVAAVTAALGADAIVDDRGGAGASR